MSHKQPIDSYDLYELLKPYYDGDRHFPGDTVWEMFLGAFLVQNTTWHNAEMALGKLKQATAFDPATLAEMNREDLVDLIYSAGFHKNKSQLIINYFRWLQDFDFDLEKVKQQHESPHALRKTLLNFKGIGNETADVLLLYAFKASAFIADNYARKLYQGLGSQDAHDYIPLKTSVEASTNMSLEEWQHFHLVILDYGKVFLKGKGPHQTPLFEYYYIQE